MERTLIIIKPDGVERGLIGPIITRFEQRGLKIVGLKIMQVSTDLPAGIMLFTRANPSLNHSSTISPRLRWW